MKNVLSHLIKASIGAVAIAGFMGIIQARTAMAIGLNFKPTGSALDGDPARDLKTNVGNTLNFDLFLNTNGLTPEEQISQVNYSVIWDTAELSITAFNPLSEVASYTNDFSSPDYKVSLLQNLAAAIGPDVTQKIATISFVVLDGLNNDGRKDFSLTYVFPTVSGLSGSQTQEVEVQPVPTPALLPGLVGMGLTAMRKRRNASLVPV